MLLPGILEGLPHQRDHDLQDQGVLGGQPQPHHRSGGTINRAEGVVADLGAKDQKEGEAHFRHDLEILCVPFRPVRQELRLGRVPEPPHEVEAQQRDQDGTRDSSPGAMPGGGAGAENRREFNIPPGVPREVPGELPAGATRR